VRHEAREGSYFAGGTPSSYANEFEALPADTAFRAPIRTPKPLVQGPQTAIVVGPPGEEILTDKYGRVKLQFHWDRLGQRDDKSSCWVRVSQSWAGAGYGFMQIPRIGQEVIVDFLEGDPDRPIVTGRVYNAEQMPPHGLPDAAVKSGLKSNSTKGGGGSNELTFDDTKDKEKVFFHAQYDHEAVIEHDETQHVKNNRAATVNVNETLTVKVDRTRQVDGNEVVTIGGNLTHKVGGNEAFEVAGNRTYVVGGNETLGVDGKQELTVGGKQLVSVGAVQEVAVASNATLSTDANREVTAGATYKVTAMTVEISAQASITLSVGGSSVKIDPSGVAVMGPLIKLN
jgi:type VI secretion system secreted protein VgrG